MPSYTRDQPRENLTFVKVSNPNMYYGWKAKDLDSLPNVNADDLASLGHLTVANLPAGSKGFIAANAPKPPRFKKVINRNPSADVQGSVTTFCGILDMPTALVAGWDMVTPAKLLNFTTGRSITVAVKLRGEIYYCYTVNAKDVEAYQAELGLILPASLSASERNKCFRGTSRPKPPRVSKPTGVRSSITKYCGSDDLDTALNAGWKLIKGEIPYDIAQPI